MSKSKAILIGIIAFFAVGLPVEYTLNRALLHQAPEVGTTANQFIAAQREGETVPEGSRPPNPPRDRRSPIIGRKDCTAANLHPISQQPPMTATVIRVVDGDTLVVSVEGIEMRVRLWGIDAPEKDQRGGREAQRQLEALAPPHSKVTVHPLSMDRYGRVVGNVGEDSEWAVNVVLVAHGRAYHYPEFSAKNNRCLLEAERAARDSRQGIWQNGEDGGVRP